MPSEYLKLPFDKGSVLPVRDGYGKGLIRLGKSNPQIVVLDADLAKSTRSDWFAKEFPARFVESGIAEQNMVGVAAGLSLTGKIPFVTTYSVFVTGRAFDQIRNTVCFSNLNVKIVGSHSGLSVGPDGGSHQGIEDIALMNVLPNMTVLCPIDANEAYLMSLAAVQIPGPVYIRLAREATEIVTSQDYHFEIGKANILKQGSDGYIISHSVIGCEVKKAIDMLQQIGISLTHINFGTIKPLDEQLLQEIGKAQKPVIIVEEHTLAGGLSSIIATWFAHNIPTKLHTICIQDTFGESGKPEDLYSKYGFSAEKITAFVRNIFKNQ